jgi:hypothetical protein
MKSLKDYEKMVKGKTCKWCGHDLSGVSVDYYDHDGGWEVEGFDNKLWLSVHCHGCDYDWSLWKLGVGKTVADVLLEEMRKYKVYGTSQYFTKQGKQCRAVVATKTKKKAAELLGLTMYMFYSYVSETGNGKEVTAAMKNLETVIVMEEY